MEDLLVDKDEWIVVDLGSASRVMSIEDWLKLDKRKREQYVVSLIFNIIKCVRGSYNKEFMGQIRGILLV